MINRLKGRFTGQALEEKEAEVDYVFFPLSIFSRKLTTPPSRDTNAGLTREKHVCCQ